MTTYQINLRKAIRFRLPRVCRPFRVFPFVLILLASRITIVTLSRPNACVVKDTYIGVCKCNRSIRQVVCNGIPHLTKIPTNFPHDVEHIEVTLGDVPQLDADQFAGCDYVRHLNLTKLGIRTISKAAFRNLYRLEHLYLGRNFIVNLDSSGKTFQFLTSLLTLDVSWNKITTIKYNSLRTISGFSKGEALNVYLEGNPMDCGCDVYLLRLWMQNLHSQSIKFHDFLCQNEEMTRPYDQIPMEEFVNCPGIYNPKPTCKVCEGLETVYECDMMQTIYCSQGTVCMRLLSNSNSYNRTALSSGCVSVGKCAEKSFKNRDRCLHNKWKANYFQCAYCCGSGICDIKSNTDRVQGRVFNLTYFKDMHVNVKSLVFNNQSRAYKTMVNSEISKLKTYMQEPFKQGLYIDVQSVQSETPSVVKFSLKIAVTVFSWDQEQDVHSRFSEGVENYYMREPDVTPEENRFHLQDKCPDEKTEINGVVMNWVQTSSGKDASFLCTDPNNFDSTQMALRSCIKTPTNEVVWSTVDTSRCYKAKLPLREVSLKTNQILKLIETSDFLNCSEVNQIVDSLEMIWKTAINSTRDRAAKMVLKSIDSVAYAISNTAMDVEGSNDISHRLLDLIENVVSNVPLRNGKFELSARTFCAAAIQVSAKETRNVVFLEVGSSYNKIGVNVRFDRSTATPLVSIPTKSIMKALTPSQRQSFKRVTFTLHHSWTLFDTLAIKRGRNYVSVSNDYDNHRSFMLLPFSNRVLSASIPDIRIENLTEDILITFDHISRNFTKPACVYMDNSILNRSGDWSRRGCSVAMSNATSTTCRCNHLTNFALLMDVYQEGEGMGETTKANLTTISLVGCSLSLAALLLTLITYCLFKNLRQDNPSKILINMCLAMIMSNATFLLEMEEKTTDHPIACKIMAVLLHYFLLASLTWMSVEAFYMYLSLFHVFKAYFSHFVLKIRLFGWGLPFLVVGVTVVANATDNYGLLSSGLCWIKNPAFYIAFVAPIGLIMVFNFTVFCMVFRLLKRLSSDKLSGSETCGTKQSLTRAVGLVYLLGLTWVFAFFAIESASVLFNYLFAILNSLQGLFIFVFYCLFKRGVMSSWKRFFRSRCCGKKYADPWSSGRVASFAVDKSSKTRDSHTIDKSYDSPSYNPNDFTSINCGWTSV